MSELKCMDCEKPFGSKDALNMHNKFKHPERYNEPKTKITSGQRKRIKNWTIFTIICLLIVSSVIFIFLNIKVLPPTTMEGHIEVNPASHIMKEAMDLRIQKHVLEHADGTGPSGIIINYNCEDYMCEPDLIPKLEKFAEEYPNNVYIAPFPKMDAKIVLTKLNKIKTLESFNQIEIENFILG